MKLIKWSERLLCLIMASMIILATMFTVFFIVLTAALVSLLLLMSPQHLFVVALRTYDLECAIISALRSAKMLTGKKWLTLKQIVAAVESKLGEKFILTECVIVLNSLIKKEVVEVGELSSRTVYALTDSSYLPQKPEKIEASQKNLKGLLLV